METKQQHRNLEDIILARLKDGTAEIVDLISHVRRCRASTTKQAVYAALRKLRREEKITTHGKRASLNTIWIEQMLEYFSLAQCNYSGKNIKDNGFAYLKEGEKVQYVFRDPVEADTFWSHALLVLTSAAPLNEDLYIYCPHEWFVLAREKSERTLLNSIVARGRRLRETIGHRTNLDYYAAKEFRHEQMRYDLLVAPAFKKQNYYINIVGNYVIETYFEARMAKRINEFFKNTPGWSAEAQSRLQNIVLLPGKTKIIISRNAKKAARLARRIEK